MDRIRVILTSWKIKIRKFCFQNETKPYRDKTVLAKDKIGHNKHTIGLTTDKIID